MGNNYNRCNMRNLLIYADQSDEDASKLAAYLIAQGFALEYDEDEYQYGAFKLAEDGEKRRITRAEKRAALCACLGWYDLDRSARDEENPKLLSEEEMLEWLDKVMLDDISYNDMYDTFIANPIDYVLRTACLMLPQASPALSDSQAETRVLKLWSGFNSSLLNRNMGMGLSWD